ncbi:MAG: sensor domain-containing diguanylate cyclase [Alphaproteobacteria bacterium]|nr:sensor domain-containing diguanylate cyclase [Alphaproteobacteria bacterium]MCL2505282.1 sensor domain-containing diguanylate cyclase [Alphaproteobacteria bacterium]
MKDKNFSSLIDNAALGMAVFQDFKPVYANAFFSKLFGYKNSKDFLKISHLKDIISKDSWDLFTSDKDNLTLRVKGIKKNKTEFRVSVTKQLTDFEGKESVFFTAVDITSQVEMEHLLLENEHRLRSVLEVLPYPIYIARKNDGRILFVNRKFCLLFKQSPSKLLHSSSESLYVDTKDRDHLHKLFESVNDITDMEVKMKTSAGTVFSAELASILVNYNNENAFIVAINDISQRKRLEQELFHQASTDHLTGINNRGYFYSMAEQEVQRSKRFVRDTSAIMIDIDHFKLFNDTYGHAIGDKVINFVVKSIMNILRQSDIVGRVGGEEFAAILPETNLEGAYLVAERIREYVESKNISVEDKKLLCTVSIGAAQLSAGDANFDDLIKRADEALYEAKNSGRNKVVVYNG